MFDVNSENDRLMLKCNNFWSFAICEYAIQNERNIENIVDWEYAKTKTLRKELRTKVYNKCKQIPKLMDLINQYFDTPKFEISVKIMREMEPIFDELVPKYKLEDLKM